MTVQNEKQPCILVCGPNPSWQKTLVFGEFRPCKVNRARESDFRASGKGVNFARAVRTWGLARPIVHQFCGGTNGRALAQWLAEEGIESVQREIKEETRCCTTVLCEKTSSMTELIDPSPAVTADDVAFLRDSIGGALAGVDAVALCGTLPKGPLGGFYAEITAEAVRAGKPVLMDSVEQFHETLAAGVRYLKINGDELQDVTGDADPEVAALKLLNRHPLECAAITDGPSRAFIAWHGTIHRIAIPELDSICNPLGAGDVCSGVMLSELLAGADPAQAFAAGLAAACASCLTQHVAEYDRREALRIRGEMQIETATLNPN